MTPSGGFLITHHRRRQSSGGELCRVGVTGKPTGADLSAPTQPTIIQMRAHTTIKNTLAACICRGLYPGRQSRRQILLAREEYSPG